MSLIRWGHSLSYSSAFAHTHSQLKRVWHLCGTPDRNNWLEAEKLPLYATLKPSEPIARKLKERLVSTDERSHWMNPPALVRMRSRFEASFKNV